MSTKKAESHASHERWLISYADFITLLFAFFVVMFASSQVDKKKVAGIAAAFESYISDGVAVNQGLEKRGRQRSTVEVSEGEGSVLLGVSQMQDASLKALSMSELAPVKEQLEKELFPEIEQGKIGLSLQPRGLVLSLRESAVFPPGQDSFTPEAVPILGKISAALRTLPQQAVRLEGHTDNVPISTAQFPSNWELSAARAMAVLELLAGKQQIEPGRMAVAGYADYHPVAVNTTPEGRAQNRRVDIVLLSRSAAQMEPQQSEPPVPAPATRAGVAPSGGGSAPPAKSN